MAGPKTRPEVQAMTMRAKYPGTCRTCGQPIRVGDEIEWIKGEGARHVTCPTVQAAAPAPVALVPGGARHERGTNRKPGQCERCGELLQPGEGRLQYCEYDTGCLKHHDSSGYHLYCLDGVGCARRAAELKAERQAAKAAAAAIWKLTGQQWDLGHREQAATVDAVPGEVVNDGYAVRVTCRGGSYHQIDHGTVWVAGNDVWTLENAGDWGMLARRYAGLASEYLALVADVPDGRHATMAYGTRHAEVTITRHKA